MSGSKAYPVLLVAIAFASMAAHAVAQAPAPSSLPPIQIVVDQSCTIQPESDPSVLGDHNDAFRDAEICHRESVLSSHHIEEKIADGERAHLLVHIAEQEYVMQNATDTPAVFVVRQKVPDGWTVDSEPQPSTMDGETAVFLVNAVPGQRVRLHVGLRRSIPLANSAE